MFTLLRNWPKNKQFRANLGHFRENNDPKTWNAFFSYIFVINFPSNFNKIVLGNAKTPLGFYTIILLTLKVNRLFLTKFTTFLTENYKNNSKTSHNTPKIDDKYDKGEDTKNTHFWQTHRTFWQTLRTFWQQFYHCF